MLPEQVKKDFSAVCAAAAAKTGTERDGGKFPSSFGQKQLGKFNAGSALPAPPPEARAGRILLLFIERSWRNILST